MVINKIVKTGKLSWEYQIENNDSFYDHVFDICSILNINGDKLKEYWENSEYGLIYILNYVREHKKLPKSKNALRYNMKNQIILKLMKKAGFDELKRDAFVKPSWDLSIIGLEKTSNEIYVRKSFIEQICKEAQKELQKKYHNCNSLFEFQSLRKQIDKNLEDTLN